MTIAHKIISAKDFIETTASGELDLKASRKLITRLAQALQSVGDVNVLIDVREAYSEISQAEIQQVVGEMLQLLAGFRNKIAIVHSNRRPMTPSALNNHCAPPGWNWKCSRIIRKPSSG